MYILLFTGKKKLNAFLITLASIILFTGLLFTLRLLIPETEITLEQRLSFLFPSPVQMSSIYMTTADSTAAEAGARIGMKWKTQKIDQYELSEITFQYPEALRLEEIKNLGQEINIHMNYQLINQKGFGFFQVWKLNQPLNEFLSDSRKYTSLTLKDFKESPLKVQDLNGFLWEYVFITKTDEIYGLEAFLERGNELYRFTFFLPETEFKSTHKKMFLRMVKSLRVKGTASLPNVSYVGLNGCLFCTYSSAVFTQFFPLRFERYRA